MNKQALFCDGTAGYVIPPEPKCNQKITLRFRAAKNDELKIRLVTSNGTYDLKKESTKGEFDYYKIDWRLEEDTFYYC